MKFRHALAILGLSIFCGWWLNSKTETHFARSRTPMKAATAHENVSHVQAAILQTEEIRRSPQSLNEFASELRRLKECEEGQCSYPQSDPKSYGFSLAQDVKKVLYRFADWTRNERLEDREVSEIGRKFMQSDDGYVQAAALELISTQPTSLENRDAILRHVIDGHDSELIEQAMLELERYTKASDRDVINQAFGRALTTGAPYVARAVASHIEPFIDTRSFQFFKDVLAHLPPDTIYFEKLEASLRLAIQN